MSPAATTTTTTNQATIEVNFYQAQHKFSDVTSSANG